MIRLALSVWWLLFVLLSPVLVVQALLTRRRAIRLAPAQGPQSGRVGDGAEPALRLLLIGESTVAGVGVESQAQGLACCLAQQWAERSGRCVVWQALGENGITAAEAVERLLPQVRAQPFDQVLLVFGVNDTTHLSSRAGWQHAMQTLVQACSESSCRVAFTAVPPIRHFTALPWLLRQVLGLRACLLDRQLLQLARQLSVDHCRIELEFTAQYLARDGYHPSAEGYRVWARGLADLLWG